MNKHNYTVIMAGGVGSRFWPISTEEEPKQFLDVLGTGKSLLRQTFERFSKIVPLENILVITSQKYKALTLENCPGILPSNVLLEPCMRNTAPAIAYASHKIYSCDNKANIVVSPSDHLITDEQEFLKVIKVGLNHVQGEDALITLGIKPHSPETGYGYIQTMTSTLDILKVISFKEKPDLETAKVYLKSENFHWNSGIFIWNVNSILKSFKKYLPEMNKIFANGKNCYYRLKEKDYINENFPKCENISIDYGIMEKAENVYTIPCNFGWSDLGTWHSVWEKSKKDENQNTVVKGNAKLLECENCTVNIQSDMNVVIQGLNNVVVAEKNGVLMICQDENKIKEVRSQLD